MCGGVAVILSVTCYAADRLPQAKQLLVARSRGGTNVPQQYAANRLP